MLISLREFLETHKIEINNQNLDEVYSKAENELASAEDMGKLSLLFYKLGIDPLKSLKIVPKEFLYLSPITSVVILDNIIDIRPGAFSKCFYLSKVLLSKNLTRIQRYAFVSCKQLNNIVLPNSLKALDGKVFYDCENLTDISFDGTKKQWEESVLKDLFWKKGTPIKQLKCIDGIIDFTGDLI